MQPCNVVEDGFRHRGCEVVSTAVVFLVAVDCDFESQNGQHQEVVLETRKEQGEVTCFMTQSFQQNLPQTIYSMPDAEKDRVL